MLQKRKKMEMRKEIDWTFLTNARYLIDHPEMLAKMPLDKRKAFDDKLEEQEKILKEIQKGTENG